jgi:SET domain-containing protein
MDLYQIKKSNIHGLGVFANKFIKAGTKIADYFGEEMSLKEFREKYGDYKNNSLNTYRMKRINRIIVAKEEPFKSQNMVNYINEGEENCILKKRALYALKDIQVNDELLLQYPKDYNREWLPL